MQIAAIDLEALKTAAFAGNGEMATVSREWLKSLHRALSGEPFAQISGKANERHVKIMGAIDVMVGGPAA